MKTCTVCIGVDITNNYEYSVHVQDEDTGKIFNVILDARIRFMTCLSKI